MTDVLRQEQNTAVSADVTQRTFKEFGGELQRFLTRRVRCANTARDLAQDVYLRFMLVSRQEEIRKPQAFLYQLASNLVYEFHMRQQHAQVICDSDLLEAADRHTALETDADPGDRLGSAQEIERLLKPLPKAYRAVLLMRKRDGLSSAEIAQRLGFSKKTVYEYLTRAIAQVKEARLDL